jgi:vacuolar-type H+-ATPase catalytic subunit A/Vma1
MKAGLITVGAAAIAIGLFGWGMRVGSNDVATFAQANDAILAAVAKQCGRRGNAVRTDAGYLCVYVNNDGSSITRTVLDSPTHGAM